MEEKPKSTPNNPLYTPLTNSGDNPIFVSAKEESTSQDVQENKTENTVEKTTENSTEKPAE